MRIKYQIFLIFAFILIIYIKFRNDSINGKITEKSLENHITFTGKILDYNRSGNHAYGIIKIRIIKSNKNKINVLYKDKLFPYRVEGDYAEFYGYVPEQIKIDQNVRLNSDKKSMGFYEQALMVTKTELSITSEERDITYIKQHTSFK